MMKKYLFQHNQAAVQWDSFHTGGLKPSPQNLTGPYILNIVLKYIKYIVDMEKFQDN